jgi:hypothetical protein
MWHGKLIRESTHLGNDKVARQMESAHRTALAKGEFGIRDKRPALMCVADDAGISQEISNSPARKSRPKMTSKQATTRLQIGIVTFSTSDPSRPPTAPFTSSR